MQKIKPTQVPNAAINTYEIHIYKIFISFPRSFNRMFIINVHKINTFNSLILFTSVQLVLFQQIKSLVSKKIHRNQNLQKIQPKSTEVCFVP